MWQLIVPYRTEPCILATFGPDHLLSLLLLSIDLKNLNKNDSNIIIGGKLYVGNYYNLGNYDRISVYNQGFM